jgi:hypothetical protein
MAASSTNYSALASTGKTIQEQWPDLYTLLGGFVALLAAKDSSGTEPNDELQAWIYGDVEWKVGVVAGNLLVHENTGTPASPTWTLRNSFITGSGLLLPFTSLAGAASNGQITQGAVTQHEAALSHDALLGFVAGEHVLHSGVTITGGTSLAGGGAIDASRVITLLNDSASPGNSKYYGTDSGGTKGFNSLPPFSIQNYKLGKLASDTDINPIVDLITSTAITVPNDGETYDIFVIYAMNTDTVSTTAGTAEWSAILQEDIAGGGFAEVCRVEARDAKDAVSRARGRGPGASIYHRTGATNNSAYTYKLRGESNLGTVHNALAQDTRLWVFLIKTT